MASSETATGTSVSASSASRGRKQAGDGGERAGGAQPENRTNGRESIEPLLRAAATVQEADTEGQALRVIAEAVQRSGWGSVSSYVLDNWAVTESCSVGLTEKEIEYLKSIRLTPKRRAAMFDKSHARFRVSRSYFIPADQVPEVRDGRPILRGRRPVQPGDTWDPGDLAYLPLCSHAGAVMGMISLDDPVDGQRPNAERFRHLEFFADLAAQTIERLRLDRDRRRAEAALKDSEEHLRALSEAAFEAIFMSEKGVCIGQNLMAEKMFGYTAKEAYGRPGTRWIAPEDREMVKNNMLSGYEKPYQALALKKDDTTFPCEIQGKMMQYRGREVRVTSLRDITDRKQAEMALQESEKKYKTLVEGSPLGVYYSDFKGTFLYGNKTAEEIIGFKREELIGKSYLELKLIDRKGIAKAIKLLALNALGKSTGPDEFELNRKDGSKRRVEIRTTVITIKGKKVVMGIVEDITDRKRAEEALKESEKKYRVLAQNMTDVVFVQNMDLEITYTSPSVTDLFGYSVAETYELKLEELMTEDSLGKAMESFQKYLPLAKKKEDIDIPTMEFEYIRKDGSTFWGELKVIFLRDSQDRLVGSQGVIRDITDRKRAEEALVKQKSLLDEVFNGIHEGIGIVDENETIEFCNPAYARIFDKEVEEVVGIDLFSFFNPEAHSTILSQTEKRKAGKVSTYELSLQTKKNKTKHVRVTASPRFKKDGSYAGSFGAVLDITERVQAEMALRQSEERFRQVAENAREWIWEVDAEGLYTYASPVVEKILGYRPEEIEGQKHFFDLFHPDDREKLKGGAFEVFKQKKAFQEFPNRNIHKDGSTVWLATSGVPILDKKRNLLGYRGADSDITDRKRAEEALAESEQRYRTLAETAMDGIYIVSPEGFHYVNPAFEALVGYTTQEVCHPDFDFRDLIHPDDLELVAHREAARTKGEAVPPIYGFRIITKAGQIKDVEVGTVLLPGPSSASGGTGGAGGEGEFRILGILRDITQRRALEKKLVQTERLAILGQVAAGVAHEVNTPLSNISLMADNLKEESQDPLAQEFADKTIQQVTFAAKIVRELLDFARPDIGSLQALDLHQVIQAALEQIDLPQWLTIEQELDSGQLMVRGDPVQLQQVVTNLVSNAADAMEQQGSGTFTISTKADDSTIELVVTDTGEGISEENLPQLFQPFFTTRPTGQGTGLGLPLVQRFIQAHGGSIEIESKVGVGTSIIITMPRDHRTEKD